MSAVAMDTAIRRCSNLSENDVAFIKKVVGGLHITADVSRADIILYCRLRGDAVIAVAQARPHSISSLYRGSVVGEVVKQSEQPILFRGIEGMEAREQRDRLAGGAPVIHEVLPVRNSEGKPIACLSIETNLIERERHRRRSRSFRRAVRWLQGMAARGEIEGAENLTPFGEWYGIVFVDPQLRMHYLSGIATNLYRRIGYLDDLRGKRLGELRTGDDELVEEALQQGRCLETEAQINNRIWLKKVIPVRQEPRPILRNLVLPPIWYRPWLAWTTRNGFAGALLMVYDVTEARQKEQELKVKSVLIKEVHHRVKNNLQTVAALLRMQARRDGDEVRRQLEQAIDRIMSVAIIHDFLSHGEGRYINLKDVCHRIVAQLQRVALTPEEQIQWEVQGPNVYLTTDQATACALVINECLQNAIEHGFRNRSVGRIKVMLEEQGDQLRIAILDDGGSLPDDFDALSGKTLGLQIVNTLVRDDLKGTFSLRNVPDGVLAEISFRKLPLRESIT